MSKKKSPEHSPPAENPPANGKRKNKTLAFIRGTLLTGLFVILPLAVTFFILKTVVLGLDNWLISTLPQRYQPTWMVEQDVYGMGILGMLIILFVVGLVARNVLGRRIIKWWDNLMHAIPGVRSIYGAVKQIVDTLGMANSDAFREVVMVEYPRKGIWALGFVTGTTRGEVQKLTDDTMINIFLPTTPNPTSGFLLFVPKKDLIKLHMTVDQGVKMVISGGIVTPSLSEGKAALAEDPRSATSAKEKEA